MMLKYILKYFHFLHCFSYSKIDPFLSAVSPNRIDGSVKKTLHATNTTNLRLCIFQEQNKTTYSRTIKSTVNTAISVI